MAFSNRPDRSKFSSRSPLAANKSPGCQVVARPEAGGLARKCCSPVFTRSPSRPAKATLRSLLKSPEHNVHKENSHFGNLQPPSPVSGKFSKTSAVPSKAPTVASPKKILGEHKDKMAAASKRSRKEWQIPSPSALELKESLSAVEALAETGTVVEQAAESFTVRREMLEEPEPVVGWIQNRPDRQVHKLFSRDLFNAKEALREPEVGSEQEPELGCESPPSHHSFAGSSSVETTVDEDEHSSKLRESSPAEKSFSFFDETVVVTGFAQETSLSSEARLLNEAVAVLEESKKVIAPVDEKNQVQEAGFGKHSDFRWSLLVASLVLLCCTLGAVTVSRDHEIWRTAPGFKFAFPAEVEWSSEADTVAFYVDPGRLQNFGSAIKLHVFRLYQKSAELAEKLRKYRLHAEDFGLTSINAVGSYYSSLVLQNHAKDVLFNYCDKFQGQYHRLRFALVSLTQQVKPMEAMVESFGRWLSAAESFVYEGLVLNYLQLPASGEAQLEVDHHLHQTAELFIEEDESEMDTTTVEATNVSDGFSSAAPDPTTVEATDVAEFSSAASDSTTVEATDVDEFSSAAPETTPTTDEAIVDVGTSDWTEEAASTFEASELQSQAHASAQAGATDEGSLKLSQAGDDVDAETEATTTTMELLPNPRLFFASALVILGTFVGYQLIRSASSSSAPLIKMKRIEDFPSPTPSELLRMRGAGEDLVLSPELQTGVDSPYGSFTAYKRVVLNEGSGKEHVKLTPVRRSSRIRNQVQSPLLKN